MREAGHRVGASVAGDNREIAGINNRVQLSEARRILNDHGVPNAEVIGDPALYYSRDSITAKQHRKRIEERAHHGSQAVGETRPGGDDGYPDAPAGRPTKTRGMAAGGEAAGTTAAAGHTLLAGTRRAEGNEDDDARPAGHTATGDDPSADSGGRADARQWLYWSLIAVTYGCLASALAMMTPWAASLPIATDALPAWRAMAAADRGRLLRALRQAPRTP